MAVRVPVRIEAGKGGKGRAIETVAVANSGFEAHDAEILLPRLVAERLGLWPPPPGARAEPFESPGAAFKMITIAGALRLSLQGVPRRKVTCNAVVSERESEVVLNDWAVDALGIDLVAVGRGLYRVGERGRIRKSSLKETW